MGRRTIYKDQHGNIYEKTAFGNYRKVTTGGDYVLGALMIIGFIAYIFYEEPIAAAVMAAPVVGIIALIIAFVKRKKETITGSLMLSWALIFFGYFGAMWKMNTQLLFNLYDAILIFSFLIYSYALLTPNRTIKTILSVLIIAGAVYAGGMYSGFTVFNRPAFILNPGYIAMYASFVLIPLFFSIAINKGKGSKIISLIVFSALLGCIIAYDAMEPGYDIILSGFAFLAITVSLISSILFISIIRLPAAAIILSLAAYIAAGFIPETARLLESITGIYPMRIRPLTLGIALAMVSVMIGIYAEGRKTKRRSVPDAFQEAYNRVKGSDDNLSE